MTPPLLLSNLKIVSTSAVGIFSSFIPFMLTNPPVMCSGIPYVAYLCVGATPAETINSATLPGLTFFPSIPWLFPLFSITAQQPMAVIQVVLTLSPL